MTATLLRLGLAAAISLGAATGVRADEVLRVTGTVDYGNFAAFAALLYENRADPVVLDIAIPLDQEEAEGHLTTFVRSGQLELAFNSGERSSVVYADAGYEAADDRGYAVKGAFTMLSGDPRPSTPDILLEPGEIPADATFRDVDAGTLARD